jgi:hypothetical protein
VSVYVSGFVDELVGIDELISSLVVAIWRSFFAAIVWIGAGSF